MKRTILSLMISLLFLLSLSVTVSAEGSKLIVDDGKLLSVSEETALEDKAATMGRTYRMDFVIVTVDSLMGKTPEAFADDYYDENGYGENGILLLVSMEDRDWYISTCGDGIAAMTDYGIDKVSREFLPDLSDGNYYEAFDSYLDAMVPYLVRFRNGSPADNHTDLTGDYDLGGRPEPVYTPSRPTASMASLFFQAVMQSVLIGLIAALVVIAIMRRSMNTKHSKTAASMYLKEGSFQMLWNQDLFLRSDVVKTRRQENSSSSSTSGSHHSSGSSVHHSSSGRSHGGHGGKF